MGGSRGGDRGSRSPPPLGIHKCYTGTDPLHARIQKVLSGPTLTKFFFSKFDEGGGGEDQNITFSIKWRFAGVPMIALH